MTTRESNDERIALLQGTLDLLILKTLVLGPAMARAWRDRFNASRKRYSLLTTARSTSRCSGSRTRSGFAQSGA